MRKVKGHATEEQVQAGEAHKEHQQGNDQVDAVADKGSKEEQQYLSMVAKLFAKKHKAYQTFVRSIQSLNFNLKKEET